MRCRSVAVPRTGLAGDGYRGRRRVDARLVRGCPGLGRVTSRAHRIRRTRTPTRTPTRRRRCRSAGRCCSGCCWPAPGCAAGGRRSDTRRQGGTRVAFTDTVKAGPATGSWAGRCSGARRGSGEVSRGCRVRAFMASSEYLADGHYVDEVGNLIACTYVDFRDRAERFPMTVLQKASSKWHAIPGCETIRISKPACFLDRGEGFTSGGESHHGTNGWIYCASIEPETAEERTAWRKAMPAGPGIGPRSARPTRARRSATVRSSTPTTRHRGWRVRHRIWSCCCCSSS